MPKKYMVYGIIIIVLAVVGYFVYNKNMKTAQIVETKDFSCPGMTGFTFKYPVFKGWEFVMNRKINNNSCEISLSDPLPSDPFDTIEKKTAEGQPRIVVSIGGPTEKSMMQTFLNPQSISYRKYTTDGYMFLDPTKKRSISVELLGTDKDSIFPRDKFFQTVIESFRITDEYVPLLETNLFPSNYQKALMAVLDLLKSNKEDPSDYVAKIETAESYSTNTAIIHLWYKKDYKSDNTVQGNPSGKSRDIYYNLDLNKITKTVFWQ